MAVWDRSGAPTHDAGAMYRFSAVAPDAVEDPMVTGITSLHLPFAVTSSGPGSDDRVSLAPPPIGCDDDKVEDVCGLQGRLSRGETSRAP